MRTRPRLAGRHDRGAGGLKGPERHEHPDVAAERGAEAGHAEDRKAEQEAGLPAEAVGESAGRYKQRRVDDGVAVEHPAEVGERLGADADADRGRPTLVIQTSSWARKLDIDRTARIRAGRLGGAASGRAPTVVVVSCKVMGTRNQQAPRDSGLLCQEP